MSENGLEGLLDKAKTSGQIAGEMGRRFCSFDSMTAREFQTMKWISEKDVVEFFKTKVVVDRKQLSDSLDRLAEDCHDKIIDELKFPAHHRHSGWAKVLQPIIWGWYEKLIHDCENGSGSDLK